VRQAAIEALASISRESLLPALEVALRDGADAGLRNAAMEIYVRLGAVAGPPLLVLLSDADEEVRLFATVMLGAIKEPSAVPALIEALSDRDVNVRHAAASSLGQIGSPRAVPRLLDALREGPWLQYPAVHALGEIGDPRATPGLFVLLEDEMLRAPAIEAIGHVAGREAFPRILPYLHDPDPALRNTVIQAVVEIEQRVTNSGESLDRRCRWCCRREELVEHLIGMLSDEEPRNRRTAAVTLGWLHEGRATWPLLERMNDPALRDFACHALVSIGYREPEAWQRGLTDPDDAVRLGAVRCLAWIGPGHGHRARRAAHPRSCRRGAGRSDGGDRPARRRGRADAALRAARRRERADPGERDGGARPDAGRARAAAARAGARRGRPRVPGAGAQTLGLMRDSGASAALVVAARSGRERCGLRRCRRSGSSQARSCWTSCARGSVTRVRSSATRRCWRSAACASPEAAPLLMPLLDEEDPRLRFAAVRAARADPQRRRAPRLLALLADPRKELRFAAIEALGQIRAPGAVLPLVDALRDGTATCGAPPRRAWARSATPGRAGAPDRARGRALERSLRRGLGARAARQPEDDRALSLRVDDPDPTVCRAAVSALGEVGNPRAAGRLVRALSDPALQPAAIEALRRLGPPALPEIERAFASGTLSPEVRRLLVDLAGRLEDVATRRLLLAGLEDPSPAVTSRRRDRAWGGRFPRGPAAAPGPQVQRPVA